MTLSAMCEELILTDDLDRKVELGKRIGAAGAVEHGFAAPSLPERPGRPAWLARSSKSLVEGADLAASPEGRRRLLFFVYIDIEIAAAEVCAANIVLHPEMPAEFRLDMARQVWDEVRHAELALARFRAHDGTFEGLTYEGFVWDKWNAGRTLAEKLAIEQVALEGNALDAGAAMSESFRRAGDAETAAVFDGFLRDEINHVGFGTKWLSRLLDPGADFVGFLDRAAARAAAAVPGRFPVDRARREQAGFPPDALAELERRERTRRAALEMAALFGKKPA